MHAIGLLCGGRPLATDTVEHYVMGVMKMGNIVPRAGLEPTSLAFQASVLPLHHVGSLMSPLYPCPLVYVALCLRGQRRLLQYQLLGHTIHQIYTLLQLISLYQALLGF